MAVGILTLLWDMKLPRGGQQSVKFALKTADGITPYPIVGKSFKYAVRNDPEDEGSPLIGITSASTSQGQLTVDTDKSTVTLSMLAAATADLAPGVYYHALWMDPLMTTQFDWFVGKFILQPATQP
jgi:hypothetical protein